MEVPSERAMSPSVVGGLPIVFGLGQGRRDIASTNIGGFCSETVNVNGSWKNAQAPAFKNGEKDLIFVDYAGLTLAVPRISPGTVLPAGFLLAGLPTRRLLSGIPESR